jgi:hypothetical protein
VSGEGYDRQLTTLSRELGEQSTAKKEKVDGIRDEFEKFRFSSDERLAELTAELEAEVALIPGLLQGGASELSASLSKAEFEVSKKINALKTKMNATTTAEEKAELEKALSVLYRIQAASDETRKAQREQLTKIANNEEYNHREFGSLARAMTTTVDAVKEMNANINTQKFGVKAQVEEIGKSIENIFDELGNEIDINKYRMQRALNESAMDAQFAASVVDAKSTRRLNQLNHTVAATDALSREHVEALASDEKMLKGFIQAGDRDVDTLATEFAGRISNVWTTLNASKATLDGLTSDGIADSSRRLRLVQGALSGFAALWDEYAGVMSGKMRSFRSGDTQFVEALQNQVKEALIAMENKIRNAANADNDVLMKIEDLSNKEDAFEQFVVNKLLELAYTQDNMNDARNELVSEARRSLVAFENRANLLDADLMQRVKDELDIFAKRVSDKHAALADV